jgi:hypothetical protein
VSSIPTVMKAARTQMKMTIGTINKIFVKIVPYIKSSPRV